MTAATPDADSIPAAARVPRLSYFFPAHNEEANLEGLVLEALERCRGSRTSSRSSPSTTARRTGRARSPTGSRRSTRASSAPSTRAQPWLRRGAAVRLRGVALRPAVLHRRRSPVPGRGPRPADGEDGRAGPAGRRGRLPHQARRPVRADRLRADLRLANRIFFGLRVRDVDCACKLFTRARWRASGSSPAGRSSPPSC